MDYRSWRPRSWWRLPCVRGPGPALLTTPCCFRRCTSVVLALVVSACASSPGTPFGGDVETAAAATRGNTNLIVRAELEEAPGQTAWQVIENLRGRWLRPVRVGSAASGPAFAGVVVDRATRGELQDLRFIVVDDIETMRRLSPSEATTRYGTGYAGGVIEVTSRGRAQAPAPRLAGDIIREADQGRPPVAGDLLRVGCFSSQSQEVRVGEGLFLGAEGGDLLLGVGPRSRSVAVPFANVRRVEVRERRSRSGVGAVIGALFGGVAGAIRGSSSYDPAGRRPLGGFHFGREVYVTFGAVVGGVGGALVGRILGSFIKHDTWLDAPQNWVVQYSESGSATPEASARAGACPSFDTDTG